MKNQAVQYLAFDVHQDAGFDHLFVHQIGPKQEGFIDFYRREVMPKLRGRLAA